MLLFNVFQTFSFVRLQEFHQPHPFGARYVVMAARLTTEDVISMLDDDYCLEEIVTNGSDDELDFEEYW